MNVTAEVVAAVKYRKAAVVSAAVVRGVTEPVDVTSAAVAPVQERPTQRSFKSDCECVLHLITT